MAAIDKAIRTYLAAVEVEGKTPRTIDSYEESLRDFRKVGRQLHLPNQVTGYEVPHVCEFLAALRRRGASAGYQNRRHREVRAFFSWCARMDMVESNVLGRVPLAKQERKIRPPLEQQDILRLLEHLDRSSLKGRRDHAMVLFLLDTGVRVSECWLARIEEIEWDECRVLVRGKGQSSGMSGSASRPLTRCATTSRAFAESSLVRCS